MLHRLRLFLQYLFRVQISLLPEIVSGLGTTDIINLVVEVLGLDVVSRLLVFIQSLWDYAASHNIEPSLSLRESLALGGFF